MKTATALSLALILCLTSGCATTLNVRGKSVRLLMKSDAPQGCEEISTIMVSGMMKIDEISRRNDLRNKAAAMGANTVTWDHIDENQLITGTAFKCPVQVSLR